jgi:heavy metal sensor kinase
VTAALSLRPVEAALRNLALALAALSTGTWLLAAGLGRRLCRRALAPLTRMSASARQMTAADLGQRLPDPGTGDELEDLGRAFNDLLARVHEAFERQRRFTGDASHQLRTPLAALLGQVEVALRRDRPAEEYRRVLGLVERRATHLRQVVESLLFLARAESESEPPGREPVDLAAWVPEQLGRWSAHARAADLRAAGDLERPALVEVHPPLLGQALDNLLDNALKYSAPGTPVTVRLGRDDGAVTLAVEDRGCGIAPEDRPHLFEPFYRSPQARRQGLGGVGLGLAVAQRIVRALGGTITVDSEPDAGSRFVMRFPSMRFTTEHTEHTETKTEKREDDALTAEHSGGAEPTENDLTVTPSRGEN